MRLASVVSDILALSGFGVLWGIGSILMGFDRYEEEHAIRTTPLSELDSMLLVRQQSGVASNLLVDISNTVRL